MKSYDLYGFKDRNLEDARQAIEDALGIKFASHESLYLAGEYFRYGTGDDEHYILRRNLDPFDGEPAEPSFPGMNILLYINKTERSSEIERLLISKISGMLLLRRREI